MASGLFHKQLYEIYSEALRSALAHPSRAGDLQWKPRIGSLTEAESEAWGAVADTVGELIAQARRDGQQAGELNRDIVTNSERFPAEVIRELVSQMRTAKRLCPGAELIEMLTIWACVLERTQAPDWQKRCLDLIGRRAEQLVAKVRAEQLGYRETSSFDSIVKGEQPLSTQAVAQQTDSRGNWIEPMDAIPVDPKVKSAFDSIAKGEQPPSAQELRDSREVRCENLFCPNKPRHTIQGSRGHYYLCCRCYVAGGGSPFEFHDDCVRAQKEQLMAEISAAKCKAANSIGQVGRITVGGNNPSQARMEVRPLETHLL